MATRVITYGRSDWQEELKLAWIDEQSGLKKSSPHGRLEEVAQDVAIARGEAVCEAMIRVAAIRGLNHSMTARGNIKHSIISCGGAVLQDATANSDAFEQQAAHLVPGQIRVDGKEVWMIADHWARTLGLPDNRLADQTRAVFHKTVILPAAFNRADSQAERASRLDSGLKRSFGESVSQLWLQSRTTGTSPTNLRDIAIDRLAISNALSVWFGKLSETYERAALRKREIAVAARDAKTAVNRELEFRVLAEYARSFKIANPMRFVEQSATLRSIMQSYRQIY